MLTDTAQAQADATTAAVRQVFGHMRPVPSGTDVVVPLTWGRQRTLRAGVRDENAVDAYTNGQCFALSFAINLATGWPVVWIGPTDCAYDEDCAQWADTPWCGCQLEHSAVRTPDGLLLDIYGPGTLGDKINDLRWDDPETEFRWELMDTEAFDTILDGPYWVTQLVEVAMPLVDTVRTLLPARATDTVPV